MDLLALKNECINNPNNYSYTFNGVTQTLTQWWNEGSDSVVAEALNVPTTNFFVYRTSIPIADLQNAINWANYTPADGVPTAAVSPFTLSETILIWQSRALKAQGMQLNLQNIIIGAQGSLNAANPGTRAGLQDAMTNLPTGATNAATFANGVALTGGWVTVRDSVLARLATRAEKLFATKTAQQDGSIASKAATLTFEGNLTSDHIQAARNAS